MDYWLQMDWTTHQESHDEHSGWKRLSIDIIALRQLIWENAEGEELDDLSEDMPDIVEWIDTSKMLVDALTKDMNANDLRATLKEGLWNIEPTADAQVTKLN